jgi:hypothetical protein
MRTYSWELKQKIEESIDPRVLEALEKYGWNVFGIYEVVK